MNADGAHSREGSSSGSIIRTLVEAESVQLGSNTVRFLLTSEETGGKSSVTIFTIAPPPSPAPPPHRHQDADETIYVLDGTLDCTVEDQTRRLMSGGLMHVSRGALHGLVNPGPGPTTILVVLAPAGFEGYWRESARLLAETGGRPEPETMLSLQRKYHMDSGGQSRTFE